MKHTYRIIFLAEYWRLMRDGKLLSTHASEAAAEYQMDRERQKDVDAYARAYAARKGE